MTAALPVCAQCHQRIRMGANIAHTNTGDMVHRDCHPNHDVVDTCPDCTLPLEWSKFGYWIHPDTGTVTCPGDTPKPARHLTLVRYPTPNTPPRRCTCGNHTDGTTQCHDCVKGYE